MRIRDALGEVRRAAEMARFRVETAVRVGGLKLGMHRNVGWEGVRLLAKELSRGKANMSTLFRYHAVNDPTRPALIQAGLPGDKELGAKEVKRLTYGDVDRLADRIGMALSRRGLGRGTAVLMLVKNRVEFFVLGPAVSRIGASLVTVSWRSTPAEIEYLANHSGAAAVFFDAGIADVIREAQPKLRDVPRRNFFSVGGKVDGFTSMEELIENEHGSPEDVSTESALVMYTSGTTGKPKGAVRKFQPALVAMTLSFIGETPMALGETHLTICPLYHATATGFSSMAFLLGGTVVVAADFKPEIFLDAVERYQVTSTAMVPTMIHRVVELGPEELRKHDLSSLRAIFSGGAPLGGQLAAEAMDALGDKIYNFYGATETGLVTLGKPEDLRAAPGTIGRRVPGNEIRLLDEQGREVAPGEVGELYARNPMLVEGYHADKEATDRSMVDGFFSVGDLAREDSAGRLFIEGRKRDMIISAGVNVYPAEIEAVLEAHPAVGEVAVVGVPDKDLGEKVRAFVAKRPGAEVSEEELKAFCKERLSGFKVPRDFAFVERLPRNPTGKVLKRELRVVEG